MRFGGVFFADQDFEAETAPGQVIAHAASAVGLDHGVNASGFEGALGEIGFGLGGEAVNDCEFAVIHEVIIHLRTAASRYALGRHGAESIRPFKLRCFASA